MLLTGSYRRALDDKLRLAIPKPLRESLPTGTRVFLTQGLDGCLAVYPESAFAALAERLAASSPGARAVRDFGRLFYSQAACVVPDRMWRFRVPPELARWAGLEGEVMIVGVRDHVELWAAEKWLQYVSQCDSHFDELAEKAFLAPYETTSATGGSSHPTVESPINSPAPVQPR